MTEKKIPSRMLFLIAAPKFAEKATALLMESNVPVQYKISGMGTATSEMMDLLGLGTAEKTVVASILPKTTANAVLTRLDDALEDLERKNRGIAFTLPISGLNKLLLRMMGDLEEKEPSEAKRKDESTMTERSHALITVIVNQGYSEEVMNAARSAGARGGTVIHGRRIMDEKTTVAMGLGVQDEREMLLIVADEEHKLPIMQAIGAQWGVHSEAKGIVLSLPIDNVIGLS